MGHMIWRYKQTVHREEMQIPLKPMKRCSTLFITAEMQIKTALRYYFVPIRLAKVQEFDNMLCG